MLATLRATRSDPKRPL